MGGLLRSVDAGDRAFTIVFSAAGPPVAALAYDLRGSYELAFLVFVGSYACAAVLVLLGVPEAELAAGG